MTEIIWENSVDNNTYQVVVYGHNDTPYIGTLKVTKDDLVLYEEKVGLSYGAVFGPDAFDVEAWKTMVMNVIENYELRLTE